MEDHENIACSSVVPNGWHAIRQPAKSNYMKIIKQMFYNRQYTDCIVVIGNHRFNTHRDLLRCYSKLFKELIGTGPIVRLSEKYITPETFEKFLDWVFHGAAMMKREDLMELFSAAEYLGVVPLQDECWQLLDNSNIFVEDQAVLLYLEARRYVRVGIEQPLLVQLLRLMLGRVKKFFLMFVGSLEFLQLDKDELCTLIKSNAIGVNNEIEVFLSVIRWLNYAWQERSEFAKEVISCVRFTLMPPLYLCGLTTDENPHVNRVVMFQNIATLVTDALKYTCMAAQFGEESEEMINYMSSCRMTQPAPRQWIYDKNCKYHHRMTCSKLEYITYNEFLQYIEMIRDAGGDYWKSFEYTGYKDTQPCCPN